MVGTFSILCEGKRYRVSATPMQTLQVLVDQVAAQLQPAPPNSDGFALLLNGKPTDLGTPVRFANLHPSAKLEITTGRSSRLGIREQASGSQPGVPASVSAPAPGLATGNEGDPGKSSLSSDCPIAGSQQPIAGSQQPPTEQQPTYASQPDTSQAAGILDRKANPMASHGVPTSAADQERPDSSRNHDADSDHKPIPVNFPPPISFEWGTSSKEPVLTAGQSQTSNHAVSAPSSPAEEVKVPYRQQPVPSKLAELGLDRNVAVFTRADLEASSQPPGTEEEVPDSFFEFGMEDYAAIMQGYSQSKTRAEAGLRTAKLRQQEEAQKASKFPQTTIRIVFPDSYILQIKFQSQETVGNLKESLACCLSPDIAASSWHVYTTPPKQILSKEEATLYQAQLCPAAKLYFWGVDQAGPFLRREVLSMLAPPPQTAPTGEDSRRREDRPKPSNSENPPTKAHRQSNGAQADGKKLPKWMKLSKR